MEEGREDDGRLGPPFLESLGTIEVTFNICWDLVDLEELDVFTETEFEDWVVDALLLLSQASNMT